MNRYATSAASPTPSDEYLWNKRGTADPMLVELERSLSTFAYQPPREMAPRLNKAWSWRTVRAVAAMVFFTFAVAWLAVRPQSQSWTVRTLQGGTSPTLANTDQLRPGRWLTTDSSTQVQIAVADIGHVVAQPNTRLRLLASRTGGVFTSPEHRLELDHGSIHAVIDAPPRLFFVNTRAAVAIDYGCEYTLSLNEHGLGMLRVEQGLVMLDGHGRSVLVPMNASCPMREGIGPGTPFGDHASQELQDLLAGFDDGRRDAETVGAILAQCTNLDTITLWHLLEQVALTERENVINRLALFVPMPMDVSPRDVVVLDRAALQRWRSEVERFW